MKVNVQLEQIRCCNCGMVFAVPVFLKRQWQADGTQFWCPNGHILSFTETTEDKLRARLDESKKREEYARERLREEQNAHEHTEARRRAEKGAKTKLKNRIGRGVCPCCNRHFADLHAHMARQHPEYLAEADRDEES